MSSKERIVSVQFEMNGGTFGGSVYDYVTTKKFVRKGSKLTVYSPIFSCNNYVKVVSTKPITERNPDIYYAKAW